MVGEGVTDRADESAPADSSYDVRYSLRQGSWYVADGAGECVSGLYDSEAEVWDAIASKAF